jgi:hypothetical protein
MPSINQLIDTISACQAHHPSYAAMINGRPGEGKSDACWQIGERLGIPRDRIKRVPLMNFDVVDLTGVPSVNDGFTIFNPTKIFYDFREGTGPGLIILEELAQSTAHHQMWAGNFVLDRQTPVFKLDPEVRILATGNRAQDKAGVKPLLGQLNNRLKHYDIDTSLDDFCAWAMKNGVDPLLIAFLRLRPDLLNDYDPNRRSNPTQRSWTELSLQTPSNLPTDMYLMACESAVGEGAAAEWVAARDMMHKMPSIDSIRMRPDVAEIPDEPAVRFAVATALSMTTEPDAFARDMQYVSRLPKEFQMVYVTDALRLTPELQTTKDFVDWAINNKDIFMGGN